ncbi:MAG: transcriptional regulator [Gammaproteobacteria bacterium]|nr:MAG: transcriptional regulator [Gammaproteobacteria bacterium]
MRSHSLGNVLFTKTQQKVLGLLFGQPERSFYLNEIVSLSRMGKGTISRELERMVAAGIIFKQKIGNQNHYRANPKCPIYLELLGIVHKTFGVADVVKAALDSTLSEVTFAFIYGSIASAEDTAKSDIDLLLVAEELAYSEVMELLFETEKSLGRPINPTIYTLAQITEKLRQENAFVTRVLERPKIWIKEDEDVYRTIRESGKDRAT